MLRTSTRVKKVAPDLLESMMKPSGFVKEELLFFFFLMKMTQFRPKILKTRICTFQMSGKIRIPAGGGLQEHSRSFLAHFHPKLTLPSPNKKFGF